MTEESETVNLIETVPDVVESEVESSEEDEDEVVEEDYIPIVLRPKEKVQTKAELAAEKKLEKQKAKLATDEEKLAIKKEKKRISDKKYQDKIKTKVIEKTKLIYIMTDRDGTEVERIDGARMSSKTKKLLVKEDLATKAELEMGMKLKRLADNSVKKKKPRSEAQLANDKRLGQARQERLAKAKVDKAKESENNNRRDLVAALKDVIKLPISTIQEPARVKTFDEY